MLANSTAHRYAQFAHVTVKIDRLQMVSLASSCWQCGQVIGRMESFDRMAGLPGDWLSRTRPGHDADGQRQEERRATVHLVFAIVTWGTLLACRRFSSSGKLTNSRVHQSPPAAETRRRWAASSSWLQSRPRGLRGSHRDEVL